jgi:hypothetical protein
VLRGGTGLAANKSGRPQISMHHAGSEPGEVGQPQPRGNCVNRRHQMHGRPNSSHLALVKYEISRLWSDTLHVSPETVRGILFWQASRTCGSCWTVCCRRVTTPTFEADDEAFLNRRKYCSCCKPKFQCCEVFLRPKAKFERWMPECLH